MDNFNKPYDTNSPGTTTSYTYSSCSCVHRLPCGYCPLLSKPCPMQTVTITTAPCTPTWNLNEVTCKAEEGE